MKNSWGRTGGTETKTGGPLGEATRQVLGDHDWGVGGTGYFYLSYYDQAIDGFATYAFMEDKTADRTISHQYDYLSGDSKHAFLDTVRNAAASVFEVAQDETLTSVGMTTVDNVNTIRVDYAIYRLREGAASPVDGELLDTVSCLYGYPGYHRERLEAPITLRKGEHFSVIVTQSYVVDGGVGTIYAICAPSQVGETTSRTKGYDHYAKAVVNPAESWAFRDGACQDWAGMLAANPDVKPEGRPSTTSASRPSASRPRRAPTAGPRLTGRCGTGALARGSPSRSPAPSAPRTRRAT